MASDKEEQQKKTLKATNTSPNGKDSPKSNSNICKKQFLIPAFAFIVAFVALGIAAYTLFLNTQLNQQINDTQNNFSQRIQQVVQKQTQTQELITEKTNYAEEAQNQFQIKFENLSKQLQNAINQKFYQNQDWLLLKARYYLELAEINAHWSNGTDSTIALLKQADSLLKQLNEPKILNVRQAIAKDIAQVQSLPSVDVAGLLSQLDAAQNSIENLSIPLLRNEKVPPTENKTSPTNDTPKWRTHLQNSMGVLEKLIVIRRHDQDIQPIMSPLFEAILKEKIRLNLQEAQWAVLNNNQNVYQLVLKQAMSTLKNFNEKSTNTSALVKQLTELQQANVNQKRPAPGTALPMLNELIDNKKASIGPSVNEEQGGNQS